MMNMILSQNFLFRAKLGWQSVICGCCSNVQPSLPTSQKKSAH